VNIADENKFTTKYKALTPGKPIRPSQDLESSDSAASLPAAISGQDERYRRDAPSKRARKDKPPKVSKHDESSRYGHVDDNKALNHDGLSQRRKTLLVKVRKSSKVDALTGKRAHATPDEDSGSARPEKQPEQADFGKRQGLRKHTERTESRRRHKMVRVEEDSELVKSTKLPKPRQYAQSDESLKRADTSQPPKSPKRISTSGQQVKAEYNEPSQGNKSMKRAGDSEQDRLSKVDKRIRTEHNKHPRRNESMKSGENSEQGDLRRRTNK
jgi:hypothetical protein